MPSAILEHLEEVVRRCWEAPETTVAGLPASMPASTVQQIASGGRFGFMIDARFDQIEGRLVLEVLTDNRMGGPDHYRVWDDGEVEPLEREWITHAVPAEASAEDIERAQAEYFDHNRAVQAKLRERGFDH